VTELPDSSGLNSPRWSPDGRYLLATKSQMLDRLALYDFTLHTWQDLVKMMLVGYTDWSRDGKCVYFRSGAKGRPAYRICLSDRKVEHIADFAEAVTLADGRLGQWTGLGPDDSPLALRDIGSQEIYALDVHFP
jgi:hypothetical protein